MMGHCNQDNLTKLEIYVRALRFKPLSMVSFVMCAQRVPNPHYKLIAPSDLDGQITQTAKGGFRYAICFVNDYSGFGALLFHKKSK